ncbi:MAG: tRNA (adenosine(37)-N6)-threonylcarbamoyltransferase complex transferase subunit TsaD [bacterium]|nr:tRNA (adenosine(37)-N6)-threonylcarbamoyltransferase complex transferase subunit TsaD [bacterium]
MKDVYILAIESSCDETSMAIVKNGSEVVSIVINTQISTHENYGGVVPEIASRMHAENITIVLDETLKKANMTIDMVDAIAVTYGPGLMGSLLVGVEAAKTIAFIYKKPLIAVNHLAGHIYANNLENTMQFPLLALVISGGHTDIVYMPKNYEFKVIGATLDDAIGEAYDKVARVLGLKYPGGPNVEKLAALGTPSYHLPIPMNDDTLNMSFSGLKSSIINLVNKEKMQGKEINKQDLACSFQTVATDQLVRKLELAIKETNIKNIIVAGGVSANKYIRQEVSKLAEKYHAQISVPKLLYCTDNAAMIGAAAYPMFLNKQFSDLSLNATPNADLY